VVGALTARRRQCGRLMHCYRLMHKPRQLGFGCWSKTSLCVFVCVCEFRLLVSGINYRLAEMVRSLLCEILVARTDVDVWLIVNYSHSTELRLNKKLYRRQTQYNDLRLICVACGSTHLASQRHAVPKLLQISVIVTLGQVNSFFCAVQSL
jgi:hypothetical protein